MNNEINEGKFLNTDRHIIGDAFIDCEKRLRKLENFQEVESKKILSIFETIEKRLNELDSKITKHNMEVTKMNNEILKLNNRANLDTPQFRDDLIPLLTVSEYTKLRKQLLIKVFNSGNSLSPVEFKEYKELK